jgi:hypothetical protein
VDAHKLPYDSKYEFLVALLNVRRTNTDQLDLEASASIECNLAVDALLEVVVGVLLDSVPFDNVGVDLVNHLEEDLTVTDILVQVVNVDTFNFEGVDPEAELALLTGTSNIVVNNTSLLEVILLLLVQLFKTVASVEDLSNVDGVNTCVTLVPVISGDKLCNTESVGVFYHITGTLSSVLIVDVGDGAELLIELVEYVVDSE